MSIVYQELIYIPCTARYVSVSMILLSLSGFTLPKIPVYTSAHAFLNEMPWCSGLIEISRMKLKISRRSGENFSVGEVQERSSVEVD